MKRINHKAALAIAAVAILGVAVPTIWAQCKDNNEQSEGEFIQTTTGQGNLSAPTDFTEAAESTINSVVSIKSFATPRQANMFNDPFFEFFFGPGGGQRRQQQESKPQQLGLGSGVIISEDGYIVTNNHVIEGAEKLEVTLNGNKSYSATVIGADRSTDLALLKIEAKGLKAIKFGDSDALRVGEWVLAVGNPFGFTSTVTAGIVSAKARSIGSATHSRQMGIDAFIQTDAAVNPGNSGGALVNTRGELVGINTAIYSQTGNYAGYSFAIPTSIVKKIITDLRKYGTVQRAVLGITCAELTAEIAEKNDITAVTEGIYVNSVEDRSAAKEAGLEPKDVIVEINGAKTRNLAELNQAMSQLYPGDKVTVKFFRNNKVSTANVTLKNNQGSTAITKGTDFTALGCAFQKLSEKTKARLGVSYGVQVVGVEDGKFREAGISDGFIILEINKKPVNSQEDVEKIYNAVMNDSNADKVLVIKGLEQTGRPRYKIVPLIEEE